ncbi:ribosome biogenesis protein WDR12 homolog isoform X2 [Dendronephthya gigantea]|uniref:ribosome biogenesis protein WDR12 homolog isoform X2 n=1 Tax=Dendronephthya gigantea TaxID=151771 RepID=UPI00106BA702|nr:ribosome biogenesis protein WDR12 homolog isoform X2 [Dendronephthya gigantea]
MNKSVSKMENDSCSQIQVNFFTKHKAYSVPQTPFSIPVTVSCDDLSALINSLLQQENILNEDKKVEFDFLISDQYITESLQKHITKQDVETEDVVKIEYIEKKAAPWPEKMMLQNDWVSSIAVSSDCILSGSYDNMVYVWDMQGNCLNSINEHTQAVKAVNWIRKDKEKAIFLSSSLDQTIKICECPLNEGRSSCLYVCKGHTKSVDCLAVHPNEMKFCSGSWDKTLKLWSSDLSTNPDDGDDENIQKKSKTEQEHKRNITRTPLMTMTGHTEAVSSVIWSEDREVLSCGWDHTIRVWDAGSGINKHTLTGGKAFNCISYSPHSKLIASAGADRHVRLWDHRIRDGAVFQKTLTSHDGWLSSVAWSPRNQFMLVSGSYDQTLILWDTRSATTPLHVLRGHNDKVMCVDWSTEQFVISGGADNQLIVHRVSGKDEDTNDDDSTV